MRLTTFFAVIALLTSCSAPVYADTPTPKATLTAASKTNAYDAINHVVDKASEGIAATAHLVQAQLPKALELAVHGVYAKGMASLVVGGLCGIMFLLLTGFSALMGLASCRRFKERSSSETGGLFAGMSVVSAIISVLFLIGTAINLLDSDSWARIISPDGYLAQAILTKALGQ